MGAVIFILALVVLPLAAQLAGRGPVWLFAGATLGCALVAGVFSLWAAVAPANLMQVLMPGTTLAPAGPGDDPGALVAGSAVSSLLGLAALWAALAALTWLQTRFEAVFYPRMTAALYWVTTLALSLAYAAGALAAHLLNAGSGTGALPLRLTLLAQSGAGLVAFLALCGLAAMLLRAGWRRLARGEHA